MAKNQNEREVLANFIMKICSKERYIEVRRQLLCDKNDFEPYVAFNRLSRSNDSNGITSRNILDFMRESMIDIRDKKTKALILHYDADEDEVLSYKEFLDIVLPKEHPDLRAFVTQRECFDITNDEYLGYETEAALALLVEREIKLFEEVMQDKEQLDELGINGFKIVEMIDGDPSGNLNFNNLKNFVHESGIIPYDSEIIAFLRRVDRDDDGVINSEEMDRFLSLFTYSEDLRLGRRRRSNLKSTDIMTKSPRRKIVNHKVSLLSSKKKKAKKAQLSNNPNPNTYPPASNVFKTTDSTNIESTTQRHSYRRTSVATSVQQKFDKREASRTVKMYPGSAMRGSATERKKAVDDKIFSSTQCPTPQPISRVTVKQRRPSMQTNTQVPMNKRMIAYDPRRESFGIHVEPKNPMDSSMGFQLSRDSFQQNSSLRRDTLEESSFSRYDKDSKNDLNYSPRRQSFGLGMMNNSDQGAMPLVYEKNEPDFRKQKDTYERKTPLAEITPNRVQERRLIGNGNHPLYKTPVHQLKRKDIPPAPITNTPTAYVTKTEIKPISPSRINKKMYEEQQDEKKNVKDNNNKENQGKSNSFGGRVVNSGIKVKLVPQSKTIQNNLNLTVSPVIERTSGYQFTQTSKKNKDHTPLKIQLNHTTTTPIKSKRAQGRASALRAKNSNLKSALKSSPKKYEKALSVRWADEETNHRRSANPSEIQETAVFYSRNSLKTQEIVISDHGQKEPPIIQQEPPKLIQNDLKEEEEAMMLEDKAPSVEYDSKCDQHLYFSSLTQNVEISNPEVPQKKQNFNFTECLRIMLEEEARLDQAKRDLFANPDFNVKKLMNMVDLEKSGGISFDNFRIFLEKIGIVNADPDVIIDFFTAYDTEQSYSLNYESVAKMVFPYDRRVVREGQYNNKEFYRLTMRDILTVFEQHLKTREVILGVKHQLAEKDVDLSELFERLDLKRQGFIDKGTLLGLIQKRDPKFSEIASEELDFFIERCDLDADGRINFRDFYLFFSL